MTDNLSGLPRSNSFAVDAVEAFRCTERTLPRFFLVALSDYRSPLAPNTAARI